ncbi:apolipoprotein N-acyltransferase [Sphingomonas profundi]|uniref:apolipoprotein N-acyltransferase n=1 Tax=Alterirhizorhabdus profundi TaxID=2681549 RepID=UPI0012E94602|nr:apolipoprotein N-acyltransferase [Sphingomonas profundi]
MRGRAMLPWLAGKLRWSVLGAAAAMGFAPLDLWPVALAALALLMIGIARAERLRTALAIGWWFGLGHFVLGLDWIAEAFTFQAAMPAWLGVVAVVLLSLYLAVYPAVAVGLAWRWGRQDRLRLVLVFAAAWIVTEWLRATLFTGFAWNPLGVLWVPLLPIAGAAKWIGTYGLGGLAILAAGLPLMLVQRRWIAAAALAAGLALAPLPLLLAPGHADGAGDRVHIVQPNIVQQDKWAKGFEARNFARLVRLTGRPEAEPRLILWPEAAVPDYLEDEPWAARRIARLLGPRDLLMTGGVAIEWDRDGNAIGARNSMFVVDPRARLLGRYDKAHLVPYGEYLPMRPILSAIGLSRLAPGDLDFWPGPGPRSFDLPGFGVVGVQVCYEIIFSGQVIDRANRPTFLFNPSNDAWFGASGPPQHLAQARLRAIEEGIAVVRATPTGISAVIDPDGRLLASLDWRTAGAIELRLPSPVPPTPFARGGNILPFLFAGLLLIAAFAHRRFAR